VKEEIKRETLHQADKGEEKSNTPQSRLTTSVTVVYGADAGQVGTDVA
jgi:hypothetical protein